MPDEDQGYVFAGVQLPDAGSLQRTSEIARQAEDLIKDVPGVNARIDARSPASASRNPVRHEPA